MSIVLTLLLVLLLALALLFGWLFLRTRSLAREAEATVPQAGQVVPVEGGAIHYVEYGKPDAPPVVLIHGISAQLQHFTYAVAPLLSEEFRVIVIDRPGCGYSRRDRDELAALPEQARMIGEFLDNLGIEKPVIAGHSLGGAVTLAIALDRPDKTAAIALIAPATQMQDKVDPIFKGLEIRSPFMRRLIGHTIAVPAAKASAAQVLAHAFAPEPPAADFMTRAGAALGLRPKAFITGSSDLVMLEGAMPKQVVRYDKLKVKGGILYGTEDKVLSADLHGRSMMRYGLSYDELEGRGHMLPITAPEDCANFIRRIAERAKPPAPAAEPAAEPPADMPHTGGEA